MISNRAMVDRIFYALAATYTDKAVVDIYHRRRKQWGGLSPHEMVASSRGEEVIEWAESLAGGPEA